MSEVDTVDLDGAYWDGATLHHRASADHPSWREHCDALHRRLLDRTRLGSHARRALKTDLFDESTHVGLVADLARHVDSVHAVDISTEVATAASARNPDLKCTVTDVRRLPYPDCAFDQVVSNSTLDHFPRRADIATALEEIHRVTADGGQLLITMDNAANPIVRLRSRLPHHLLRRLRLVPYYVGETVTERGLADELARAGFTVRTTGTMMHAPRIPAMIACRLVDRLDRDGLRRLLLRALRAAEALERLPTRQRTGYYVTASAVCTRPSTQPAP
jgi:SAM-dependent methyltransferase